VVQNKTIWILTDPVQCDPCSIEIRHILGYSRMFTTHNIVLLYYTVFLLMLNILVKLYWFVSISSTLLVLI